MSSEDTSFHQFARQDRLREVAGHLHPGPDALFLGTFDIRKRNVVSTKFVDDAVFFGDLHVVKGTMSGPALRKAGVEAPFVEERKGNPHVLRFGSNVELFDKVGMQDEDKQEYMEIWTSLKAWANQKEILQSDLRLTPVEKPISPVADFVWKKVKATPYVALMPDSSETQPDSVFIQAGDEKIKPIVKRNRRTNENSARDGETRKRTTETRKRTAETQDEEDEDDDDEEDENQIFGQRARYAIFDTLRSLQFLNRSMVRELDIRQGSMGGTFGSMHTAKDILSVLLCGAVLYVMNMAPVTGELDLCSAARKLFRIDRNGQAVYPVVFSKAITRHFMPKEKKTQILRAEQLFFLYAAALAPHNYLVRNCLFNVDFVNQYIRPCVAGEMIKKFEQRYKPMTEMGYGFHEVSIEDALECFNTNYNLEDVSKFSVSVPPPSDIGPYIVDFFNNIKEFKGFTVGALASSRLNYWLQTCWSGTHFFRHLNYQTDVFEYIKAAYAGLPVDNRPTKQLDEWHVIATRSTMYPSRFWGVLSSRDFTHRIVESSRVLTPLPTVWDGATLFPYLTGVPELAAAVEFLRLQQRKPVHPVVAALMGKSAKWNHASKPLFNNQNWPHVQNLGATKLAEHLWNTTNDKSNFVRAFLPAFEEIGRAGNEPMSVVRFYDRAGSVLKRRLFDAAFFSELLSSGIFDFSKREYVSRMMSFETKGFFTPAVQYVSAVGKFDEAVSSLASSSSFNMSDLQKKIKIFRCNFEPQIALIFDLPDVINIDTPQPDRINALVHFALKHMETFAVGGDEIAAPAVYGVVCKKSGAVAYSFCGPIDALFRRQRDHRLVDSKTLSDFSLSATDVADRAMFHSIGEFTWTTERRFEMTEMMGAPHAIWIAREMGIDWSRKDIHSELPAVFEAMLSAIGTMDRVPVMRTYFPAGEMIDLARYQQRVVCLSEIYKNHLLPNGFKYVNKPLDGETRMSAVVSHVKWFWRSNAVYYFIYTPEPRADLPAGTTKHIVDIGISRDIYFERDFGNDK